MAEQTPTLQPSEFSLLLEAARGGDAEALHKLLQLWRPMLRRDACGAMGARVAARCDSSDLVQNTLTRVFLKIQQFRGHTKAEWIGWLRRILQRESQRTRRRHLANQRDVRRETGDADDSIHDIEPSTICSNRETQLKLYEAIRRLPANMRVVVVRRVFEQESFESIAAGLGKTSGSLRVIWTRAVRALRDDLKRRS